MRPVPPAGRHRTSGAIAQLGERVLCKHEVVGSIPSGSTIVWMGVSAGLVLGRKPQFAAIHRDGLHVQL